MGFYRQWLLFCGTSTNSQNRKLHLHSILYHTGWLSMQEIWVQCSAEAKFSQLCAQISRRIAQILFAYLVILFNSCILYNVFWTNLKWSLTYRYHSASKGQLQQVPTYLLPIGAIAARPPHWMNHFMFTDTSIVPWETIVIYVNRKREIQFSHLTSINYLWNRTINVITWWFIFILTVS